MNGGWIRGAVATAILLVAKASPADDVDELRSLLSEDVVTTASTSAEQASTAPATSITVSAEELRTYGIRTLAEAVQFLSVGVVASDPLTTPELGARGVLIPKDDGKHFLLLVNGHAMNDPLLGAARFDQGSGVPIDVIDRIEIIVGPGSVLYGSNAMLGVINVITKNAKDYQGGHIVGEYEPGRTGRAGVGAGIPFELFDEPSELTLGSEYFQRFGPDLHFEPLPPVTSLLNGRPIPFRRGGPADGRWGGTVEDAYFMKAVSGLARLRVGDFELNVMASRYEHGIPYTTDPLKVDFDDAESNELERAVRVDLTHHATFSALVQLTSRLYADSFDFQRRTNRDAVNFCFRSDFQTCQIHDAGLARWAGIDERLSLNWFEDQSFVTMLGLDARMRWVSAKQEQLDFDTGKPFAPTTGIIDDQKSVVSPYIQQTWTPNRYVNVNAGARLTADQRFSPVFSPRGAIAFTPLSKTTLKTVYSQAFRAPTFFETDSSGFRRAAATGLDPEIVRSIEGSIEQRFGTQRVMFGVFRTWWDDLVEPRLLTRQELAELQQQGEIPVATDQVVQSRNIARIDNYGYNTSFEGSAVEGRLSYGFNLTSAFSRRSSDEGTAVLPVAPQFFGNARVAYAFEGYLPTPALAVSFVDERPADRGPKTAPGLARFRGTLTGRISRLTGLGYRVTGTYATASRGPYVAGPGGGSGRGADVAELPLNPVDEYTVFFGLRYDFLGATGYEESEQGVL